MWLLLYFCSSRNCCKNDIRSQQTFVLVKTSWRRLRLASCFKKSWRRFDHNDLIIMFRNISLRHRYSRDLQDVFKTHLSRQITKKNCSSKMPLKRLQVVYYEDKHLPWQYVFKSSSRSFEDILIKACLKIDSSLNCVFKT